MRRALLTKSTRGQQSAWIPRPSRLLPDDEGHGDGGQGNGAGSGSGQGSSGDGSNGGQGNGGSGSGSTDTGDRGFPANTPVEQMSIEQQAAYWKHYSRRNEQRLKDVGLTPEEAASLKAKAAQLDQLEEASRTDQERAVAAARTEGRQEALRETAPRLVAAEFRAAAKGVLTAEQVTSLLEDLDTSKFLTDKGEVDIERVAAKVNAFAPQGAGGGQGDRGGRRTPDLGQGDRGRDTKPSVGSGMDRWRERHGSKTSTS